MNPGRSIFVSLTVLLAAAASVGAYHPSVECKDLAYEHAFGVPGVIKDSVVGRLGVASVYDGCLNGDGDADLGVKGGRFPAGTSSCLMAPEEPHHAYGVGAEYWAWDETGIANLVYEAGADGPIPGAGRCATDGIISNDPWLGPLDCGAGQIGIFLWPTLPATLGETVGGSGACDPFDGYVWVIIYEGLIVIQGQPIFSTPISGHIGNTTYL